MAVLGHHQPMSVSEAQGLLTAGNGHPQTAKWKVSFTLLVAADSVKHPFHLEFRRIA